MVWRAHSSLLFSNWLNYFVYQETPFDLTKLVPHRRALQKQDARPSSERSDEINEKVLLRRAARGVSHTIPVLTGFTFLGLAYGILLAAHGFGPLWALATSLFVFAGSMQYFALGLLVLPFDPVSVFLLTLTVNARHLFYGISMLEPLRSLKKPHPYLIFAMCDETFSLYCSAKEPEGVDREAFSALDRRAESVLLGGGLDCRRTDRLGAYL